MRSLLGTARVMEDNPLLRLRSSLERLVEKVRRIDLHAGEGQGLDALLTGRVRLKAKALTRGGFRVAAAKPETQEARACARAFATKFRVDA